LAREKISEMEQFGLSTSYVHDLLLAANSSFQKAQFAELVANSSGELAKSARDALEGDTSFRYEAVFEHTEQINRRYDQAFRIFDSMKLMEQKIKEYENENVNATEARKRFEDAIIAFDKERYQESEELLSQVSPSLEESKEQLTTLNVLAFSSKNFFEKNWRQILVFALTFGSLSIIAFLALSRSRLKSRLASLKKEEKGIEALIMKAQEDRYNNKSISKSDYQVRMHKYKSRTDEIKRKIPVLESRLK